MKYKFELSSLTNRIAFAIGIALIIGTSIGYFSGEKKYFAEELISENYNYGTFEAGELIPTQDVKKIKSDGYSVNSDFQFNLQAASIASTLTFGVLLVLNGFVKK
jgi:hypothetical protein